jgi:3-oxoacyl-[acyl-carrier protein] reductase
MLGLSGDQAGPFYGKVAVVTGSSSGIGLEVARHFGAAGARVVTNGRTAERAQAAARTIEDAGGTAIGVDADLSSYEGAEQLVRGAIDAFGGVDILVNCAGISMIARSDVLDPGEWERAIATDLSGPYFCSRAVYPSMKERGGGVIINIGSAAAHVGLPLRVAYCAAKHGLSGLTKVLALDWAPDGIRVLQIDPAYIKTPLDDRDQETGGYDDAAVERRTPMGRFGDLSEVAKMVLVAAGPESSYMTGSSLLIDGGWVAYGYL